MTGQTRAVIGFLGVMVLVGLGVIVLQSDLIGQSITIGAEEQATESAELEWVDTVGAVPVDLIRVVDGDSLELEIDGIAVDVRIVGVNAPELFWADGRTCNGMAAKDALAGLVDGEQLLISGDEIDRFGRRLGDVIIDEAAEHAGRSVAFALVESGNALATGNAPQLRETMKNAAADRRGLWGDGCGTRGASELVIGETQVDPPGSDRDNLNDEWVTVVNDGEATVDLLGWTISDDTTGHRFDLDGELAPGAVLTVRSGIGSRSENDFHLDEAFPVWSNRLETVLLTDPDGVVAAWRFLDP